MCACVRACVRACVCVCVCVISDKKISETFLKIYSIRYKLNSFTFYYLGIFVHNKQNINNIINM